MGSKEKIYSLKLICLNVIQYVIYMGYSLIAIPAATLYVMVTAIFSARRSTLRRVRRLIDFWAIGLSSLTLPFVRISYENDNKDDEVESCIYVYNHRSFLDGFLVAYPCWDREAIQVVNIWPFKIPVLGVIARIAGYLNVNSMPFEDFSDKAKKLIAKGVSIITFPEGTRSEGKKMGPFHSSMFRVALEAGCPIVPVCISGCETVLRRGNVMLRPGQVKIHELTALRWDEYKDMAPFQLKTKVREMIIRELSLMEGDA